MNGKKTAEVVGAVKGIEAGVADFRKETVEFLLKLQTAMEQRVDASIAGRLKDLQDVSEMNAADVADLRRALLAFRQQVARDMAAYEHGLTDVKALTFWQRLSWLVLGRAPVRSTEERRGAIHYEQERYQKLSTAEKGMLSR